MEFLTLIVLVGSACLIGNGIYKSGKSEGSRKGYHVGRSRGRRK